jgi:hypothetical protein
MALRRSLSPIIARPRRRLARQFPPTNVSLPLRIFPPSTTFSPFLRSVPPQGKPILREKRWRARFSIGDNKAGHHSIVVGIASPDIQLLIEYYGKVHAETKQWVGIQFRSSPTSNNLVAETGVYGIVSIKSEGGWLSRV